MFAVASHADSSFHVERGFGISCVYSEPVSYGSVFLREIKVGTTAGSDGKLLVSKDFETFVSGVAALSCGVDIDIVCGVSISNHNVSSYRESRSAVHSGSVVDTDTFRVEEDL